MIPTFPFPNPCNALASIATHNFPENPQIKPVTIVLHNPAKITGLRPMRSDRRPQGMPVRHWHREKVLDATPTQVDIEDVGTPKD